MKPDMYLETPKRRPPGVLAADYFKKEYGYYGYRKNGTKDWLMMYTISGLGIVEDPPCRFTCKRGNVILIPPGITQIYYTPENSVWEKMWCHFTPRPNFYTWLSLPVSQNKVISIQVENDNINNQIHSAFEEITHYSPKSYSPMAEELAINALEKIILLIAMYQRECEANSIEPRIREVMEYLMQNYTEQISIKELAHKICLSPSRLTHLFKEHTGQSITEILQKYRLKQAAKLLKETSRTVFEISIDVGINSPNFFSRAFLKFYGMSPTKYRQKSRMTEKNT